jgi:hypothetical protein
MVTSGASEQATRIAIAWDAAKIVMEQKRISKSYTPDELIEEYSKLINQIFDKFFNDQKRNS